MNKLRHLIPVLTSLTLLVSCTAAPTLPDTSEDNSASWKTAEHFLSFASTQSISEERQETIRSALSEASDGRIYCNIYPSGRMGSDTALMQAVHCGALSAVQASTSVQVDLVPELALLDIPYLFSDRDTCNELLNGPLLDFFQPYYNENGLQLLGWTCASFRQLTSNTPVEIPSDLTQLKIRTMDNKYHQLYWSSVGASPCTVEFSNLFYAIQQGLVNAQENTTGASVGTGIHKLQDYLILTDHLPFINAVVMNKECYDQLSPAEQAAAVRSLAPLPSFGSSDTSLNNRFVYVLTPSPALREALETGSTAVREALKTDLGTETIQRFYEILEAES